MVEAALLGWTLTVVFALTGARFVFRLFTSSTPGRGSTLRERTSSLAHLVMSAAMIAMVWPWGMSLPAWPQIGLFALAAVWFLGLAVSGRPASVHGHRSGRVSHVHHALMMSAMVWMIAAMPLMMSTSTPQHGGHHHHGSAASATTVQAASSEPAGMPEIMVWVSLVLAVFFILSSLRWISAAVDVGRGAWDGTADHSGIACAPITPATRTATAIDAACHGAMSVGMGAMFLATI